MAMPSSGVPAPREQRRHLSAVEVRNEIDTRAGARIRGGPVWGGLAVALSVWLVLTLFLFWVDLAGVDIGVTDGDTSSWVWNGLAGVVAFLIGGFVAGMSSPSRSSNTGALDGVVVWAMGLLATIVLTALVGGLSFGALGAVFSFEDGLTGSAISPTTIDDFQDAAGWTLLFALATLIAAAVGGMVGAKMWPRRDDLEVISRDLTVR